MTTRILLTLLCSIGGPPFQVVDSSSSAPVDGSFVHLAMEYARSGDRDLLSRIADTPAARHMATHAQRVSMSEAEPTTALDFVGRILSEFSRSAVDLHDLAERLAWFEEDRDTQRRCWEEAAAYLPEGALAGTVLYLTVGYDIGVAVSGEASLNMAHPHFVKDRREIGFYCVHEIHHAGFQKYHDLPRIADIKTTRDLARLIRYLTTLEGGAVHAARSWRAESGAMESDLDYAALLDPERMKKYEQEYFELYLDLSKEPVRPLEERDWEIVERMSGGDRLWYRVGARMAERLEQRWGREGLIETLREGPDDFFSRYAALDQLDPRWKSRF